MDGKVLVYTDGSRYDSIGNNVVSVGAYSFIILVWDSSIQNYRKIFDRVDTHVWADSHRMEVLSVIEAMKTLKLNPNINKLDVEIYSDSMSLIDAINENRLETWELNDWFNGRGIKIRDRDLLKELLDLTKELPYCKFIWVKSHSGNTFHTYCDKKARTAAYHKVMELKTKGRT